MNRTIKFRGKRVDNGQWAYGYLFQGIPEIYDTYIMPCEIYNGYEYNQHLCFDKFNQVIPESVGQFTGLTDKNGNEIYEGDIIKSEGQDSRYIQTVEFHNTNETCGRGWVGVNHVREFLNSRLEIERQTIDRFSYFSMPCHSEIIGNIYENKELLSQSI